MIDTVELSKASMAFQLKNGEVLLISKEDVNEIAKQLLMEMLVNKQNQIFMHKDTAIDKCNLLYKIVVEQKEKMVDDVRQNYFKAILELIESNATETVTLKEEIDKNGEIA